MTTYWEVETYSKRLIQLWTNRPSGLNQIVVAAKGASNERCLLEVPDVSFEFGGAESYMQVDGDETEGASALSLSYDSAAHEAACLAVLRAERDVKLSRCDWTQLADVALTQEQKDAWVAYRQTLRDLPESLVDARDFNFDTDWPAEPS